MIIVSKPVLITGYVNPDLDAYAGIFAYAEFLKNRGQLVQAAIMGEPHDEVKYVLKRFLIPDLESVKNDSLFDSVILVDASDLNGLGGNITPFKVKEIIDHRRINEADKFPQAKVQIELVGAAATLIAERFQVENLAPSAAAALLLYSAIISNTLNFQAQVTTTRDKNIALWLKKFIAVSDNYWQELFLAKSDLSGPRLMARIEGDFARFEFGNQKIGIAQLEIIGAKELLDHRGDEVIIILQKIKEKLGLDFIFQNTIDLEAGKSYLMAGDQDMQALLTKSFGVSFQGAMAAMPELLMRKQLVPILKEELEK